jgi:hypothetical protein
VVIWQTKDMGEIRIEWPDRCSTAGYRIQICRQPGDADCRSFDVDMAGAPEVSEAPGSNPSQLVSGLQACSAYVFQIYRKSGSEGDGDLLFTGFHRTPVDGSSDFRFRPSDLDIRQNSTSLFVRWRHVDDCVAAYHVSADLETTKQIQILAPNLSDPDADSVVGVDISGSDLLRQCRNYSITIAPVLNLTELDDSVKALSFEASVFYFNAPGSYFSDSGVNLKFLKIFSPNKSAKNGDFESKCAYL